MAMIVTVLGGSAQSTPWLVRYLARKQLPQRFTLRLAGRDSARLAAVACASRQVAAGAPITLEEWPYDLWEAALNGADVVLIQVRIGGYEGRRFDETFSLPFGVPGDEGLGPGGIASVLRTWPQLAPILALVERCAPRAFPILLTSPAGLLVRFARRRFPHLRLAAICELPFTTLRDVCSAAGEDWQHCTFSYGGVNHLGWLYDVRCRDGLLCESAINPRYGSLHFKPAEVLREQLGTAPRACRLANMQRTAMAAFKTGDRAAIEQALGQRPAPWYTEAIGPLLCTLAGAEEERPFFFTMARGDEVLERAYRVSRGAELTEFPSGEAPPYVSEFNARYEKFEQAAEILLERADSESLTALLSQHPWIQSEDIAFRLAGEILRGGACSN